MKKQMRLTVIVAVCTMTAIAVALVGGTVAWFTANRFVGTNSVSARTGRDDIELQVSSTGGKAFSSVEVASIVQVNTADSEYLYPVSTDDLIHFVQSASTEGEQTTGFRLVQNEESLFHGRVYLRAVGNEEITGRRLELYLDSDEVSEGALSALADTPLAAASRIGLSFDGKTAAILQLSDKQVENSGMNTTLHGKELASGQVLHSDAEGTVTAVADPSKPVQAYCYGAGNTQSLLTMELNRIYQLDIYFYLEGCDPDCVKAAERTELTFHLSFLGLVTQ